MEVILNDWWTTLTADPGLGGVTIAVADAPPSEVWGQQIKLRLEDAPSTPGDPPPGTHVEYVMATVPEDGSLTLDVKREVEEPGRFPATGHVAGSFVTSVLTSDSLASVVKPSPFLITEVGGANPLGLRYRGVSMSSSPDPSTDPTETTPGNSAYWGTGFSLARVKLDIENAIACGCNVIRAVGNGHEVISGAITLGTYLTNWRIFLEECRRAGLYVYVTLVETNALSIGGATPSLSAIQPIMVALARVLDRYQHVIGIDLFNELNNGKDTSWLAPTWPLIRAATTKPLTCDVHVGSRPFPTTGFIASVVALGADFLDLHSYIGGPDAYTVRPSDFEATYAAFGLPILVGEVAGWFGQGRIMGAITAHRAVAELPFVAGCIFWVLTEYERVAGEGIPPWDGLGNSFVGPPGTAYERTRTPNVAQAFRTMPTTTRPMVTTTDLTPPPGETNKPIVLPGPADDPAWCVEALITDTEPGATIRVSVYDEAGALLDGVSGEASALTGSELLVARAEVVASLIGTPTTTPDTGPGAHDVVVFGSPTASGSGLALNGTSDRIRTADAFAMANQEWTVEAVFARSSGALPVTVDQSVISGPWGEISFDHTLDPAVNGMLAAIFDGTGYHFLGAPIPADTSEHHVAITWDGFSYRYYVNRAMVDGFALAVFTALPGTIKAGGRDTNTLYFAGHIRDVAVHKVARSTTGTFPAGPPVNDADTLLLVPGTSITPGTNQGVARVRTPLLPSPSAEVTLAHYEVENLTGAGGTVQSVSLIEVRP